MKAYQTVRLGKSSERTLGILVGRWLSFAGSGAIALLVTTPSVGYAQQSSSLPPPPTVSVPDLNPTPQTPTANTSTAAPKETVFQAPLQTPVTPQKNVNPGNYLVYVNGNSPYLLQQVRRVEPRAFMQQWQGQQVIQVGTFNSEANAKRQVELLSSQGIGAEIAAQDLPRSTLNSSNRYLVIIPASQAEFPTLTEKVMRLGVRQGVIQAKTAPLGSHLEIGPFADWGEAEVVSRNLRKEGMDARVHYNR